MFEKQGKCCSLPSRLTRLCSHPHHRRAILSAGTRDCLGIGAGPDSAEVSCNPPHQSDHCSQRIRHISEPQKHTDR